MALARGSFVRWLMHMTMGRETSWLLVTTPLQLNLVTVSWRLMMNNGMFLKDQC